MRRILPVTLALTLLAASQPAAAQQGFLFNKPVMQLTLRGGSVLPLARSDVFDFMMKELTIERGDFRAPTMGGDLAALIGDHVDLVVGLSLSEARTRSEFRDWEGADGEPIAQNTMLRTIPLSFTLRYHPVKRGREVADYAWLPARTTPYIGLGTGVTWYRLEQDGEFLNASACKADPETGCDIFLAFYESGSHAQTVHALAGVEHWLLPRVGISLEARYTSGSAGLSQQFRNWEKVDLSNFEAGIGLSFRW